MSIALSLILSENGLTSPLLLIQRYLSLEEELHIPLCNIKECKQLNIAKINFFIVEEQLAIVSEQCSMLLHNSHATVYNYLLYINIAS
jgi:hypothetical protein